MTKKQVYIDLMEIADAIENDTKFDMSNTCHCFIPHFERGGRQYYDVQRTDAAIAAIKSTVVVDPDSETDQYVDHSYDALCMPYGWNGAGKMRRDRFIAAALLRKIASAYRRGRQIQLNGNWLMLARGAWNAAGKLVGA